METLAIKVLGIVAAVVVSAFTRLNAVVLGRPVSVPWLGVVGVAVVLALAAGVLWIARNLVTDGLRLRPRMVAL